MRPVIDLSWRRKREIIWLGQHSIDEKLLHECAYYPRPKAFSNNESPCVRCSFEKPNEKCKYAHILTLTEKKVVRNKYQGFKLNDEDLVALTEFLANRRKGVR